MTKISRLKKELSAQHVGLVLFDTLNGYLHSDDPRKQAFLSENNILPNMQQLLSGARAVGMTTFYPSGMHGANHVDCVERLTDTDMELNPSPTTPILPRFKKGSWEVQIPEEIAPLDTDVIIPKNRWNAFHATNLELQMRVRGLDTIIIAGGSTDVGIASTVFAARDMDCGIVVVRDACYSTRGGNHDFFMDRVFPRMGRVMSVKDTVALMTA